MYCASAKCNLIIEYSELVDSRGYFYLLFLSQYRKHTYFFQSAEECVNCKDVYALKPTATEIWDFLDN